MHIVAVLSCFLLCAAGTAELAWGEAEGERGYAVFEMNTLLRLSPGYEPGPDELAEEFRVSLARGEYKSLQFGVHAIENELRDIRVSLDLPMGVDVRIYHRIEPALAEELAEAGLTTPGKLPEAYLEEGDVFGGLAAGESVNFWVTFRAGEQMSGGEHRGVVRVEAAGRPASEFGLVLEVRPFELARARAAFGMYYSPAHTVLEGFLHTGEPLKAIYSDMAAHGMNSVTFYDTGDFSDLPPENSWMVETLIPAAIDAGLAHPDTACMFLQRITNVGLINEIAAFPFEHQERIVNWLNAEGRMQGWPELLMYTKDEPAVPLEGFRDTYAPFRHLPIRVTTAKSGTAAWAYGDFHDVLVVHDGAETPELFREAERQGNEVWTYSYRILREGEGERVVNCPLRQRHYAGLHTWAHRLTGNYVWAYSHLDTTMSHVWWRPESHEPMPVIGWEARREGVDDYRYLQMVEDIVKARRRAPETRYDPLTVEAAAWLEMLRARAVTREPHRVKDGKPFGADEYEQIRRTASSYIERFWPVEVIEEEGPALRDEAAAYRGRSVEECIAGLGSTDARERRSAAAALIEKGPAGSAAAGALAETLSDEEVRMVSLRALLEMGAEARSASGEVAALLSHPDRYVSNAAQSVLLAISEGEWDTRIPPYYSGHDDPENLRPELKEGEKYFRERVK